MPPHALSAEKVGGSVAVRYARLEIGAVDEIEDADDRDVQAALFGAIPKLRAFARVMTSNVAFADDLVYLTVSHGWTHRGTVGQDDIPFLPWLFQILRDLYYADPRRGAPAGVEEPLTVPASRFAHLRLALGQLQEPHREILFLVGGSGFGHHEVARILRCASGTVKSRLSRARKALAHALEDWVEGEDAPPPGEQLQ